MRTATEIGDPYNTIAVVGPQEFELIGEGGRVVPIDFNPDAAYIIRTLLAREGGILKGTIADSPDFHDICGAAFLAAGRFNNVVSGLRFTFTALRSTLIQVSRSGRYNTYRRNPSYTVVDDSSFLTQAK